LGKRTGGKHGAPFGNRNRLLHGTYSRERVERRAKVRALLRRTRALICRLDMFARSRNALLRERKREARESAARPKQILGVGRAIEPGRIKTDVRSDRGNLRGRARDGPPHNQRMAGHLQDDIVGSIRSGTI
jgi:hypothetical protein